MAQCKKLLQKARNSLSNLRFKEVCKLAECYGWEFDRQVGSHAIYINRSLGNLPGSMMNFQDDNGQAKRGQVRQLVNAIDEYGLDDD